MPESKFVLAFVSLVVLAGAVLAGEEKADHRLKVKDLAVEEPSKASAQSKAYALFCKAAMAQYGGKTKEAIEMLEEAAKLDPTSEAIQEGLIELYAKEQDQRGYLEHVKKLVELDPKGFHGHWSLGLYYEITRRFSEAAAEFEKAIQSEVTDPTQTDLARLKLAAVERELGDPKKAIAVCELILKGKPKVQFGHRANLLMGQCYLGLKDYSHAVERFKNCIALDIQGRDPSTLMAYQGMTDAYLAQKKFDEAITLLTACLRMSPENFEFMRLLASTYEKAGRVEDAIKTYRAYTAADPKNLGPPYLLAIFYEKAGKGDLAADTYSRIINGQVPEGMENFRLLSCVNLSNIYARQNRCSDAIDVMRKAVAMVPEQNWAAKIAQDVLLHLVFLYDQDNRPDDAEALLKKMLQADPENPQANNYLGYFYADRGIHLDRAEELVRRALKASPDNGAYLDSLGWALFKKATVVGTLPAKPAKGELQEGRPAASLQEALDLLLRASDRNRQEEGNEDPVILDHIAVVHFCLGRWEKAKESWEASLARAKELEKDRPNALPNIEQVRKRLSWVTNRLDEEERSRRLHIPIAERENPEK